jgi:DNA (cytosine-5)-methyltransferase 1
MRRRFVSVCSGIEAASVAWLPLGWECDFVSEIDPFASAVLAYRYPGVKNLGDFTQIKGDIGTNASVIMGGTPCQGFSIAGLGKGLADDRSNLALAFLELAYRMRSKWVVWENVPGVLSRNQGRDFACFLGGLTGLDISVPTDGWRNSGIISGASVLHYGCSYRTLDAQHFGCPASRGRVFVVGYLGDWRPSMSVLIERNSLSVHRKRTIAQRSNSAVRTVGSTQEKGRTIAFTDRKRSNGRRVEWQVELAYSPLVRRGGGNKTNRQIVDPDGVLRTLTSRETERILGFPDDWTLVPCRDRWMANTHRNEMLGNTIAVPVLRWIGERIDLVEGILNERK